MPERALSSGEEAFTTAGEGVFVALTRRRSSLGTTPLRHLNRGGQHIALGLLTSSKHFPQGGKWGLYQRV